MRIVAPRERGVESLAGFQAQARHTTIAGFELYQHFGQPGIAGRPGHQAHMRSSLEDALPFLLRHASNHGEHFALAAGALELVEPVEYLLLGLVANAAGVVHNQSGGFGSLDLGVAAMNKSSDDLLGIMRIHLAAEGLDVKSLLGHYVLIIGLSYSPFLWCLSGKYYRRF